MPQRARRPLYRGFVISWLGMLNFKRYRMNATLAIVLLTAGVIASLDRVQLPGAAQVLLGAEFQATGQAPDSRYKVRAHHDPEGTGRFYMGREVAQVMGPGGIEWLDRPQRESQEHSEAAIKAMDIRRGDVVADLGAGSGYFTFRIAPLVGRAGKVLAVDIQPEMLETLRQRAAASGLTNVEAVKGTETDPMLPPAASIWC